MRMEEAQWTSALRHSLVSTTYTYTISINGSYRSLPGLLQEHESQVMQVSKEAECIILNLAGIPNTPLLALIGKLHLLLPADCT